MAEARLFNANLAAQECLAEPNLISPQATADAADDHAKEEAVVLGKGMAMADAQSCVSEPLTEFQVHPQRCSNPFCHAPMTAKNKHAPVKLACSDRCRMDRYVLRRAKAMLDEVGIVEFNAILQRRSF